MGRIFQEIGLVGSQNKYMKLKALFDTGAIHNYISKEFKDQSTIDDIGIIEYHGTKDVIFADGSPKECSIVYLKLLNIGNILVEQPKFHLFDMKMCDVIIGAKLMQKLNITLNPSSKDIIFS